MLKRYLRSKHWQALMNMTALPIKHLTLMQHLFNNCAVSPLFCFRSINGIQLCETSNKTETIKTK